MATKKTKAVYLGGGGKPYTVITGTPAEIEKKAREEYKINPANLYGENLGFGHTLDDLKKISGVGKNEEALREFGIKTTSIKKPEGATSLSPTSTLSTPITTGYGASTPPIISTPTPTPTPSPTPSKEPSIKKETTPLTQKGVQEKVEEKVAPQYIEGNYYKEPSSSTVYQYMAGEFRPVESEEVYRFQTGAKAGEPTDWSKVQTVSSIPKDKVGKTITAKITPLTEKELTPEYMEKLYKTYLGQDYEPGIDEETGEKQTWESIARHHALHGTTKEELINWLKSDTTQAKAEEEKLKREGKSKVFKDSKGRLYIRDESGRLESISEDEYEKRKAEGTVSDITTTLTESEENLVTTISEIKTKKPSEVRAADLINAGFSADDAAKIIASVNETLPKWSKTVEEIDKEYAKKREDAEKAVWDAEEKLIAKLEQNSNLVDTFNTYYNATGGPKEIGDEIKEIDNKIDDLIRRRDAEVLDIRGEVIPQWMITGEKALAIARYTDEANRLLAQRNALVDDYNRKYDEVLIKVGYASEDTATDAKNLAALVDLYEGRKEQVNEKLIEALERGKVKYEESTEEIMNQIKAGLAPTLTTIAEQAAMAKLNKTPTTIGTESMGYYQYDPATDSWTKIIEGTGKEISPSEERYLEKEEAREDILIMESVGATPEEIREYLLRNGFDPTEFEYGKTEVSELEAREKTKGLVDWESLWAMRDEWKEVKDTITREDKPSEGGNISTIYFKAKKDFSDEELDFFKERKLIDKDKTSVKKGEILFLVNIPAAK